MTIKKISVFCGAHVGKSSNYKTAGEQIGKLIAENGLELIFGGGNVGFISLIFFLIPFATAIVFASDC